MSEATATGLAVDPYGYWREELANPGCNDRDTNRTDICGFYRIRGAKTKPDYPAAIWSANGLLRALISRTAFVEQGTEQFWDFLLWGWMKASAVTESAYRLAIEAGYWADGKPASKVRI